MDVVSSAELPTAGGFSALSPEAQGLRAVPGQHLRASRGSMHPGAMQALSAVAGLEKQ